LLDSLLQEMIKQDESINYDIMPSSHNTITS